MKDILMLALCLGTSYLLIGRKEEKLTETTTTENTENLNLSK
ncbi:hypothetical protein [Flavobacterium sp. J27]|nr:hypothetical protein [Flavobacterium sp. J27]